MTEQCCEHGCDGGACEVCPCCTAGWCVMGTDGLPDSIEALADWVDVAREYNPAAAEATMARHRGRLWVAGR